MPFNTKPFDASTRYLADADQIALLNGALATGRVGPITAALQTVAKARGITAVLNDTGLSRAGLHKALSDDGNPRLDTLAKIIGSFGLELRVGVREPKPVSSDRVAGIGRVRRRRRRLF